MDDSLGEFFEQEVHAAKHYNLHFQDSHSAKLDQFWNDRREFDAKFEEEIGRLTHGLPRQSIKHLQNNLLKKVPGIFPRNMKFHSRSPRSHRHEHHRHSSGKHHVNSSATRDSDARDSAANNQLSGFNEPGARDSAAHNGSSANDASGEQPNSTGQPENIVYHEHKHSHKKKGKRHGKMAGKDCKRAGKDRKGRPKVKQLDGESTTNTDDSCEEFIEEFIYKKERERGRAQVPGVLRTGYMEKDLLNHDPWLNWLNARFCPEEKSTRGDLVVGQDGDIKIGYEELGPFPGLRQQGNILQNGQIQMVPMLDGSPIVTDPGSPIVIDSSASKGSVAPELSGLAGPINELTTKALSKASVRLSRELEATSKAAAERAEAERMYEQAKGYLHQSQATMPITPREAALTPRRSEASTRVTPRIPITPREAEEVARIKTIMHANLDARISDLDRKYEEVLTSIITKVPVHRDDWFEEAAKRGEWENAHEGGMDFVPKHIHQESETPKLFYVQPSGGFSTLNTTGFLALGPRNRPSGKGGLSSDRLTDGIIPSRVSSKSVDQDGYPRFSNPKLKSIFTQQDEVVSNLQRFSEINAPGIGRGIDPELARKEEEILRKEHEIVEALKVACPKGKEPSQLAVKRFLGSHHTNVNITEQNLHVGHVPGGDTDATEEERFETLLQSMVKEHGLQTPRSGLRTPRQEDPTGFVDLPCAASSKITMPSYGRPSRSGYPTVTFPAEPGAYPEVHTAKVRAHDPFEEAMNILSVEFDHEETAKLRGPPSGRRSETDLGIFKRADRISARVSAKMESRMSTTSRTSKNQGRVSTNPVGNVIELISTLDEDVKSLDYADDPHVIQDAIDKARLLYVAMQVEQSVDDFGKDIATDQVTAMLRNLESREEIPRAPNVRQSRVYPESSTMDRQTKDRQSLNMGLLSGMGRQSLTPDVTPVASPHQNGQDFPRSRGASVAIRLSDVEVQDYDPNESRLGLKLREAYEAKCTSPRNMELQPRTRPMSVIQEKSGVTDRQISYKPSVSSNYPDPLQICQSLHDPAVARQSLPEMRSRYSDKHLREREECQKQLHQNLTILNQIYGRAIESSPVPLSQPRTPPGQPRSLSPEFAFSPARSVSPLFEAPHLDIMGIAERGSRTSMRSKDGTPLFDNLKPLWSWKPRNVIPGYHQKDLVQPWQVRAPIPAWKSYMAPNTSHLSADLTGRLPFSISSSSSRLSKMGSPSNRLGSPPCPGKYLGEGIVWPIGAHLQGDLPRKSKINMKTEVRASSKHQYDNDDIDDIDGVSIRNCSCDRDIEDINREVEDMERRDYMNDRVNYNNTSKKVRFSPMDRVKMNITALKEELDYDVTKGFFDGERKRREKRVHSRLLVTRPIEQSQRYQMNSMLIEETMRNMI